MKKYSLAPLLACIASLCLTLSACKKDKNSAANCNQLNSLQASPGNGNTYTYMYEHNNNGQVIGVTEKTGNARYNYTYENGGLRILKNSFNTPALKDSFELNSDGYIIYRVFHFTNGPAYYYYTYDGNGFLASETYDYYNTGNPRPFAKQQAVYSNTVTNGNLTGRVTVNSNKIDGTTYTETSSWEYDESKTGFPEFFSANHSGYEFLGSGYGKCSKNAAVKINRNGVKYNYTYVLDAKGRLKEINGIYVGTGSAYSNQKFTYTYNCN